MKINAINNKSKEINRNNINKEEYKHMGGVGLENYTPS
jgi:hypothetical protein